MPDRQEPVKIILVTGYLGAGKTTLLNHILANDRNLRAAIIVNDIGEVNIDESLIREGGFSQADSIIPLTNGCICCTLADDLAEQLGGIADTGDFDYIVIEASGICEPMPIAYTISEFCIDSSEAAAPLALDNIVTVVDCARMIDEFDGGKRLFAEDLEEDDVESLLVEQIEFCSTIILNKTDLITEEQLGEVKAIVRSLQKDAVMIEAQRGDVPLEELLDTGRFDFDAVFESATWLDILTQAMQESESPEDLEHDHEHDHDHDHDHEHEHVHGHGHHHHGDDELEYGFSSFVYDRRAPFDLDKFAEFAGAWPDSIIRTKGMVWVSEQPDVCYLLEQAGTQRSFIDNGPFVASLPADEQARVLEENPGILNRWDEKCGDRQILLVFIGRNMDRADIEARLDACLVG
ncbi:MAG: GTP-binding protein [Eggerthellaceae bacterium]|nr:GTP-binding protein [Eggerthellaceae bacterium]